VNPESFIDYWGKRRLAANRVFNILTSNYVVATIDRLGGGNALDILQDFLLTHDGQLPLNVLQEWSLPPRFERYLVYTSPLQNKGVYDLISCLQSQEDRCGFFRNVALELAAFGEYTYHIPLTKRIQIDNPIRNYSSFGTWVNDDGNKGLELEFQRLEVIFADFDEKIPFYQLEQERWEGVRDWTQDMGPWTIEENYHYLMFTYLGDGSFKSFNFPSGFGGES